MVLLIILIIAIIGGYIYLTHSRLLSQIEAVRNNEKQLDIQLERRFKVLESLITVLQKYLDHERSNLKDILILHNQAQTAQEQGDNKARFAAESEISAIAAQLDTFLAQYPNLKSQKNITQLQIEITHAENKLAYAKQAYNESVEIYQTTKLSFPATALVAVFKTQLNFDFAAW